MSATDPDPEPVPLQDPRREYRELRDEIDAALHEVAESGRYVLGERVRSFEDAMAERLGVEHAVGVASGTDALLLALRAVGVGPGDEVVTSPFTFFATAEAVLHAGADPVFADIRPDTFNLDPAAVEEALTERTAAIVPVHLYGQMGEMGSLLRLADEHGVAVVEDAAQALGATQEAGSPAHARSGAGAAAGEEAGGEGGGAEVRPEDGLLRAGAAGDVGCLSFYPTKNLGAWGDAGMVVTDDAKLAARLRRLRDHGQEEAGYRHREVGYNSRLDALQAAVLGAKLPRLEAWNERRRAHAAVYDEAFRPLDGVEPPPVLAGNRHAYQQYTVRCRERERLTEALSEAGVGYGIYYPAPVHLQEPLSRLGYVKGDLPEAERAAAEVLSLPVFPTLTGEERERVTDAVREAAGG